MDNQLEEIIQLNEFKEYESGYGSGDAWNKKDFDVLKRANYVYLTSYNNCVKVFTKNTQLDYSVICGGKREDRYKLL